MSREAVVNYMTPLGLAHIMATGHHYGPAPWASLARAGLVAGLLPSCRYARHRVRSHAEGERRRCAVLRRRCASVFGDRAQTPDSLLLWFHHVGWTERTKSGRTLWERSRLPLPRGHRHRPLDASHVAFAARRRSTARASRDVDDFLAIQEHEAVWWRDAALSYFQTFSHLPVPNGYEPPAHPLVVLSRASLPGRTPWRSSPLLRRSIRRKPRCPAVY